jgi:predicted outer membrane protein
MKIWNKFILAAAGISIATATALAADYNVNVQTPSAAAAAGPVTPQNFVDEAVWSGDKEVAMGRLALERSQNPTVRAFAQRMIHDHSRANDQLITIADNEGLSYPATNVFYFGVAPAVSVTGTTETSGTTELSSDGNQVSGLPSNPENENPKGLPAQSMTLAPWAEETNADIISYRNLGALSGDQFDKAYANMMVEDHSQAIQKFENAEANLDNPRLKQFAQQTLGMLREHYQLAQNLQAKVNGEPADTP